MVVYWLISNHAVAMEPWEECAVILGIQIGTPFKVTQVEEGIYHLSFSKHKEMTSTFLRFQEHYESPEFRGKIFSRNEFKKWYRTQREGQFTYHEDWGGFNIPSYILNPFYEGKFKNLTHREKDLLEAFKRMKHPFYIIGTMDGKTATLNHEISHGRFYTNLAYRQEILDVLTKVDITPIEKWLLKIGYDQSVVYDEAHTYLLNDVQKGSEERWLKKGIDIRQYEDAMIALRLISDKYYPPKTDGSKAIAN
jgi:hypothetical protein